MTPEQGIYSHPPTLKQGPLLIFFLKSKQSNVTAREYPQMTLRYTRLSESKASKTNKRRWHGGESVGGFKVRPNPLWQQPFCLMKPLCCGERSLSETEKRALRYFRHPDSVTEGVTWGERRERRRKAKGWSLSSCTNSPSGPPPLMTSRLPCAFIGIRVCSVSNSSDLLPASDEMSGWFGCMEEKQRENL